MLQKWSKKSEFHFILQKLLLGRFWWNFRLWTGHVLNFLEFWDIWRGFSRFWSFLLSQTALVIVLMRLSIRIYCMNDCHWMQSPWIDLRLNRYKIIIYNSATELLQFYVSRLLKSRAWWRWTIWVEHFDITTWHCTDVVPSRTVLKSS